MKPIHHTALRALLASAAVLSLAAGSVLASSYLAKPIMQVVSFAAAGGSPDVVARMLGASMMKSFEKKTKTGGTAR